jgi:peptide/nickel transport system substrate-binding protein
MRTDLTRRRFLTLSSGVASVALAGHPSFVLAQADQKTLNVILAAEPGMLACGIETTDPAQTISGGKILQSLIRFNENNEPEGELAESWTVSPDGLTYTFKLRENVTWHDGTPFTADDVIHSVKEILPVTQNRTRGFLKMVTTAEKDGDYSVALTLDEPFLPFMSAISSINMPILPKHLYEDTDYRQNPFNAKPVGTGPFKFNEWRRGEYVHLVRNENYWGEGQPHVDEVYFHFIPDSAQRAIAMETGRGDVATRTTIAGPDLKRLLATGDFVNHTDAYNGLGAMSQLRFNLRRPPFDNKLVRKALTHAVDRQFLIDTIFSGQGRVPLGPIATGTRYFDADACETYPHDPEKAKALLDEAGLTPDSNGIRGSFELIGFFNSNERQRMAEVLKLQFAEVGFDVTTTMVDVPTIVKRDTDWDFDCEWQTIGQFYDPAIGVSRNYLTDRILHAFQNNTVGYSNARVDELWQKAMSTTDEAEAQKAYSEIQSIITDDAVSIWLIEWIDVFLTTKAIANIDQGPLTSYYSWAEVEKG